MEKIVDLPYPELPKLASRNETRSFGKCGRQTIMFRFKDIKIREGFNVRTVYTGIEELADSIAVNGLTPLIVDVTKEGEIYLEQGYRRHKAITLLDNQKRFGKLQVPGMDLGYVECFCNNVAKTELQRIKDIFVSNSGEPLTYEEKIATVQRIKNHYGLNNLSISHELGISRQTVDNMLILASAPKIVRTSVESKLLTPTAAVTLLRKKLDEEGLEKFLTENLKLTRITQSEIDKYFPSKIVSALNGLTDSGDVPEDTANRTGASENGNPTRWEDVSVHAVLPDSDTEIPEDTSHEEKSHQSDRRPPQQPRETFKEETIDTAGLVKDETIWCTDVIKDLDWMDGIISKSALPNQTKDDLSRKITFSIKKLESIKEFTVKAERR